jgi:hypothetical protein
MSEINPTFIAAHVNMKRIRDREAKLAASQRADRQRRQDARAHGYRGPLTRAELAAKVARSLWVPAWVTSGT